MLTSELLDDHQDALKAKEGEIATSCREMKELSAAKKTVTEEVSRLKVDLDHETVVCSNQEEMAQLKEELEKKGSEALDRDSELQQKEFALQAAQQELEKMRQRAEGAEATLRSERDAFEEAQECLKDDLSRALVAQDEEEAREQATIDHCQRTVKVFKFKKRL